MRRRGIVKNPSINFGEAHISGHGVRVSIVAAMHRAGESVPAIAAWYATEEADVRAAIRYAKRHPEELQW